MEHYYNSTDDLNAIVRELSVEQNNPLLKDIIRLARLWHTDKSSAKKMLSYEYDMRREQGTMLNKIEYNNTGTYTTSTLLIGRGCLCNDITQAKIILNYSSILNTASTRLAIQTTGSVALGDVLNVIAKVGFEGPFQIINDNYVEICFKNINLNSVLTILKSLEASYEAGYYKTVQSSW